MRILHTFFNVDQERAWNVYVWLWYYKQNIKRALTPFFVVVANAEKIFCWAAWKVINGCVHSWMNFGSVYLHHDMSALWSKTEKVQMKNAHTYIHAKKCPKTCLYIYNWIFSTFFTVKCWQWPQNGLSVYKLKIIEKNTTLVYNTFDMLNEKPNTFKECKCLLRNNGTELIFYFFLRTKELH